VCVSTSRRSREAALACEVVTPLLFMRDRSPKPVIRLAFSRKGGDAPGRRLIHKYTVGCEPAVSVLALPSPRPLTAIRPLFEKSVYSSLFQMISSCRARARSFPQQFSSSPDLGSSSDNRRPPPAYGSQMAVMCESNKARCLRRPLLAVQASFFLRSSSVSPCLC